MGIALVGLSASAIAIALGTAALVGPARADESARAVDGARAAPSEPQDVLRVIVQGVGAARLSGEAVLRDAGREISIIVGLQRADPGLYAVALAGRGVCDALHPVSRSDEHSTPVRVGARARAPSRFHAEGASAEIVLAQTGGGASTPPVAVFSRRSDTATNAASAASAAGAAGATGSATPRADDPLERGRSDAGLSIPDAGPRGPGPSDGGAPDGGADAQVPSARTSRPSASITPDAIDAANDRLPPRPARRGASPSGLALAPLGWVLVGSDGFGYLETRLTPSELTAPRTDPRRTSTRRALELVESRTLVIQRQPTRDGDPAAYDIVACGVLEAPPPIETPTS